MLHTNIQVKRVLTHYLTEEDALRHITAYAAYTPMNMDRETGQNKKREFTLEVLNNDLFPHCQTMPQKIMMLGYMAIKLIQSSQRRATHLETSVALFC